MKFDNVDRYIFPWAKRNRVWIDEGWENRPTRVCHVSTERGECFQINVGREINERVVIFACSIETLDDRELEAAWNVPFNEVPDALNEAWNIVETWFEGSPRIFAEI